MNFELEQVIFILLSILFHRTNFSTLSKQETDLFENKFPLKLDRYSFTFKERRELFMTKRHYKERSLSACSLWMTLCIPTQKRKRIILQTCHLPHSLVTSNISVHPCDLWSILYSYGGLTCKQVKNSCWILDSRHINVLFRLILGRDLKCFWDYSSQGRSVYSPMVFRAKNEIVP